MSKKGPLSKTEKDTISSNKNMNITELSNKLDRSESVVKKYLAQISTENTPTQGNDIDLFARNKERGVVVMTEVASMAGDENKKTNDIYNTRKYKDIIHKFKKD